MNAERAFEIAERLAVLQDYPRPAKAIGQISEQIAAMCKTDQEGERLLEEITLSGRHTKWGGPGWLRGVYQELFGETNREECRTWEPNQDTGELCPRCASWGSVQVDGKYERCDCLSGQELPDGILQRLNNPGKRQTVGLKKITASDFAEIMRPYQ